MDILTKPGTIVRRLTDGQIGTLQRVDVEHRHAYVDMHRHDDDVWCGTLEAFEVASPEQIFDALRLTDTQRAIAVDLLDSERTKVRQTEEQVARLQEANTNQMETIEQERGRALDLIREKTDVEVRLESVERERNQAQAEADLVRSRYDHDIRVIGEHMIEAADDNNMCEVYDSVVESLNAKLYAEIARRYRHWDVMVEVTVTIPVTVPARDEDEARQTAGDEWRDRWDSYDAADRVVNGTTGDSDDFDVEEIDR